MRSGPSGGGSAVYAATTWSATWRREITADGRGRPRLPCSARQRQPAIHPERQGDRMAWTAPPAAMNRRRLSAATYYRECKGSASALAPLSLRAALGLGADRYRGVARIEERARPRAELGSRAVARHEALAAVRQQLRPHWEGAQSTRSTPGGCAEYPEEYRECAVQSGSCDAAPPCRNAPCRYKGISSGCAAPLYIVCRMPCRVSWWLPCVTGCADPSSPTLPAITSTCAQPPRVRSRSSSCTIGRGYAKPRPARTWRRSGIDAAATGPVPVQMWTWGRAQTRCCSSGRPSCRADVARGEPSRGADVAGGGPSPGADVAGVGPVLAQMWRAALPARGARPTDRWWGRTWLGPMRRSQIRAATGGGETCCDVRKECAQAERRGRDPRGGEERDGRVRGAEERRSEESGACSRTASVRHLRRQCAQALETRTLRRAQQPLVVGLRLHGDARGL